MSHCNKASYEALLDAIVRVFVSNPNDLNPIYVRSHYTHTPAVSARKSVPTPKNKDAAAATTTSTAKLATKLCLGLLELTQKYELTANPTRSSKIARGRKSVCGSGGAYVENSTPACEH